MNPTQNRASGSTKTRAGYSSCVRFLKILDCISVVALLAYAIHSRKSLLAGLSIFWLLALGGCAKGTTATSTTYMAHRSTIKDGP